MLDYLAPRFKGPITIGEVAAAGRMVYDVCDYPEVIKEYKGSNSNS